MGKFSMEGFGDLEKQLQSLVNTDEVAGKMLNEAAPILEGKIKEDTASHKWTGDLYNSIKPTGVMLNQYGHYLCIRPTGISTMKKSGSQRGVPVRNMEKMAYLEYGTSSQPATPVLSKAVSSSEKKVLEKMQEVFNRETTR